jgi:hypothetical protein
VLRSSLLNLSSLDVALCSMLDGTAFFPWAVWFWCEVVFNFHASCLRLFPQEESWTCFVVVIFKWWFFNYSSLFLFCKSGISNGNLSNFHRISWVSCWFHFLCNSLHVHWIVGGKPSESRHRLVFGLPPFLFAKPAASLFLNQQPFFHAMKKCCFHVRSDFRSLDVAR